MNTRSPRKSTVQTIQNETMSLSVDAFGGAITDFHLCDKKVNPLSFRFTKDQMPDNNKAGAPFQGHFLCLGRWGEPTAGEKKAGIPDHGHFANIMWAGEGPGQQTLKMQAESDLEGLKVDRVLEIDKYFPVYLVTETVSNIRPLGRLYNMVQHPTLAAPFLHSTTRIQCNATKGFHYNHYRYPEKYSSDWPHGIGEDKTITDLRSCEKGESAVFSFIVNHTSRFGWITAYSPESRLIIGYLWDRWDYAWINLWKNYDKKGILYCGLEFGTTGIHQPFKEILKQGKSTVFNNNTFEYIDAGDKIRRQYISFLLEMPDDFNKNEIESVDIHDGTLYIKQRNSDVLTELKAELIKGF